ncbi:MAG: methyltransferase domain-containing protein [Rhodospirillales bacterium]
MTSDLDRVRDYYDARRDVEWQRLEASWLEFAVTYHFIQEVLEPGDSVLDIGGGPGRYALALAAAGHPVDLADLSPACLALAETEACRRGLSLRGTTPADARDLSCFADAAFDCVLNLGPLYHLTRPDDRRLCVAESLRVLKPGGYVFFAFLSRYAALHFTAKTAAAAVSSAGTRAMRILREGRYRPAAAEDFFVDAVFDDPAEIATVFDGVDLERESLFGAESFLAQSEARLADLPKAAREDWTALAIATARTPAALYGSEHLVFVGRKPAASG